MARAEFAPPGMTVNVHGRLIRNGMVYVGSSLVGYDGEPVDPCLIDEGLQASGRPDIQGKHLDYFPSYSKIDPESRLAFLDWLAGGARSADYDVGYAFLYLYGFERAAAVDRLAEHRDGIVAETDRLIRLHRENRSFRQYADQLVDIANLAASKVPPMVTVMRTPACMEICLGWKASAGLAIEPIEIARLALAKTPSGRKVVDAAWVEFENAFRQEIATIPPLEGGGELFGATTAMVRGASKSHQALMVPLEDAPMRLPAFSGEEPHWKAAIKVAKEAIDAMKPYLAEISRDPDIRGTDEAMRTILVRKGALDPQAVAKKLAPWADDSVPLTLAELAKEMKGILPERINAKAMAEAEAKLAPHGLGLVPSSRLGDIRKVDAETSVRIIRIGADWPNEQAWRTASLLARISSRIGGAAAGEGAVASRIGSLFPKLGAKERLEAYCMMQNAEPPDRAQVAKEARSLAQELKRPTALFVASVVAANGGDGAKEEALRIYAALGVPAEELWNDIHDLTTSQGRAASRGADGIDRSRVEAIRQETAQASKLLGEIFVEDAEESKPASRTASPRPGLSEALGALLDVLSGSDRVPVDGFEAMARAKGLMPQGALDAINDWSFETHGDAALEEDGDHIQIRRDIIEAREGA